MNSVQNLTIARLFNEIGNLDVKIDGHVYFDFCKHMPTLELFSYRGYYEDLAIGYTPFDRDKLVTNKMFVDKLKACIGTIITGYKGGDYIVGHGTNLWVAEDYGNHSETAIVDVKRRYNDIILVTATDM